MPLNLPAELSRFTAQAFIAGLWQGFVLISAVAICLRLLPRLSASVRFAIWGFVFALVVTTPLLHLRLPAVQQPSAIVHLSPAWGFGIAAIWIAAVIVRGIQLALQAVRLRRIWQRATPVAVDAETLALLQSSKRAAQLCTSSDIDSPSVIGFLSPRLLIPESLYEKLTQPELRQIILHECEHLRRGDDWMNLLQKIALALFPLNPALLFVDRRLSLERELACDAGVVAATAAPINYASNLTRLAEHRIQSRRLALALSAWNRQSELAKRVHNLLRPMRTMSPLRARVSVALLSLGLGGGAVELARAPRFIAFTDVMSAPVEQAAAMVVSPGAVRPVPVIFHAQTQLQPRATLLKAVMPSPANRRTTPKSAPAVQLRTAHAARVSERPREVLTTATLSDQNSPDRRFNHREPVAVYTLSTDFTPSYAAVPFGDGWLIIQL